MKDVTFVGSLNSLLEPPGAGDVRGVKASTVIPERGNF